MTHNLFFSFLFWEGGNLHSNDVRQRVGLNWCFLSPRRVSSSATSPSARCYPGSSSRFCNSFLKMKYFFYSEWMKHTFFSAVISVCAVNFQFNQNRLFLWLCEQFHSYSFLILPPTFQDLKKALTCIINWFYLLFEDRPKT